LHFDVIFLVAYTSHQTFWATFLNEINILYYTIKTTGTLLIEFMGPCIVIVFF